MSIWPIQKTFWWSQWYPDIKASYEVHTMHCIPRNTCIERLLNWLFFKRKVIITTLGYDTENFIWWTLTGRLKNRFESSERRSVWYCIFMNSSLSLGREERTRIPKLIPSSIQDVSGKTITLIPPWVIGWPKACRPCLNNKYSISFPKFIELHGCSITNWILATALHNLSSAASDTDRYYWSLWSACRLTECYSASLPPKLKQAIKVAKLVCTTC